MGSSRKVYETEAKDYWITCAAWDGGYGESFEIGIRHKASPMFKLVQASWNEASVVKAAGAVVMMLNDGYTPTEIQEVFPC